LLLLGGLLWLGFTPQWRSFDRMGDRRFEALDHPSNEILVGVVWPTAANQDGMLDGVLLAQAEINAGGLAGRRQLRLVVRDPGFDWEAAKDVAIDFSDMPEMSAVLGYYDDSQAIKASSMYEASRLLHIIVGSNATPMTTHHFQFIARTVVASDKVARALAQMSVDRGRKKVALLWEEGAYGEDLAYQYHVALDALDVSVVYQWSYARERADFRETVNELRDTDADTIFFAGLEPWAGDFIRMARAVGVQTEIVGAFSDTPEMRARAGAAIEGAMFYDEYDVGSTTPENQAFVGKFRARYGRDPDTWAAQGYDALHILARAARSTGSRNSLDLSYAIRFMQAWEGANGRYKFDNRGDIEDKPIYVNVYRDQKPVMIQASRPTPAPIIR
jgi:branched-chain amino acid transport system substrate-binding protein